MNDEDTRTVIIPAREEHEGFSSLTVTLPWRCMYCDGPRGEPFDTVSYDGSRRLHCHGWTNPCGHIEKYSAVRERIDTERAFLQAAILRASGIRFH